MCQRAAAFVLLTLLPALTACSRSAGVFSEQNARAHVSMLAETIGSRPIGSEANARARAYVIDQLRLYGYQVRVQETDAQRPDLGRTAHVSNIIASLGGQRPEAIGLVAHYDSAPESPGAADDGLGVAVVLETARVVAARPDRRWTTFVLVTDGEEASLMGAAALVTDRVVAANLKAYINVEGAGSDGAAVLFQTGPGNGWLTGAWARRAPHPRGGSFGIEVYRRLPNDTDFTIFAPRSIPGLNFAAVDDGYSYHTARDEADGLTSRSLRMTGENVAAVADALERVDISTRERWEATYFDIGRMTAVSYGMVASWIVDAAALLLGVIAAVRVTRTTTGRTGGLRFAAMALWAVLGSAAVVAAMIVTTEAVRAGRAVYHPWYAYPDRLFRFSLAVALATGWAMARTGGVLAASHTRSEGATHHMGADAPPLDPAGIRSDVVRAECGLSLDGAAPRPSVCLIVTSHRSAEAVRIASVVVLGISGTLWLRNTLELLRFAAALFGRLPVIMPVYVFAALITAAGVMVVPPILAIISRPAPLRRPVLVPALCLSRWRYLSAAAELAPAYTYDRPLRRYARALQEPDAPTALWEVASNQARPESRAGCSARMDAAARHRPGKRALGPLQPSVRVSYPRRIARTGACRGHRFHDDSAARSSTCR